MTNHTISKKPIQHSVRVYSYGNNKPPHKRHIARINSITYPAGYFETGGLEITGDVAVTLCGKFIRNHWDGENISNVYTDGSPFLVECGTCLKRHAAALAREAAFCDDPSCLRPALPDDIFCARHRAEENALTELVE